MENFSLAIYDDRDLVEEIHERYIEWAAVVAERVPDGLRCLRFHR